jgi:hypothetical protein
LDEIRHGRHGCDDGAAFAVSLHLPPQAPKRAQPPPLAPALVSTAAAARRLEFPPELELQPP